LVGSTAPGADLESYLVALTKRVEEYLLAGEKDRWGHIVETVFRLLYLLEQIRALMPVTDGPSEAAPVDEADVIEAAGPAQVPGSNPTTEESSAEEGAVLNGLGPCAGIPSCQPDGGRTASWAWATAWTAAGAGIGRSLGRARRRPLTEAWPDNVWPRAVREEALLS
jgi:hypothetical protein